MGKQNQRWKQSKKSGFSYKRAYHKRWKEWQKASKEAKGQGLPVPALTDFVNKADYLMPPKKAKKKRASPAHPTPGEENVPSGEM